MSPRRLAEYCMNRMTLATATSFIGFVTCNADPTTKYIIAADVDSSRTISRYPSRRCECVEHQAEEQALKQHYPYS